MLLLVAVLHRFYPTYLVVLLLAVAAAATAGYQLILGRHRRSPYPARVYYSSHQGPSGRNYAHRRH